MAWQCTRFACFKFQITIFKLKLGKWNDPVKFSFLNFKLAFFKLKIENAWQVAALPIFKFKIVVCQVSVFNAQMEDWNLLIGNIWQFEVCGSWFFNFQLAIIKMSTDTLELKRLRIPMHFQSSVFNLSSVQLPLERVYLTCFMFVVFKLKIATSKFQISWALQLSFQFTTAKFQNVN